MLRSGRHAKNSGWMKDQASKVCALPLKVLVGASSGGHTNELLSLLEHADRWPCRPMAFVTTQKIFRPHCAGFGRTYVIGECNRRKPLAAAGVVLRAFRVAWTERPDVLVTTGAMPLAILACAVKLLGGKVVWIDSVGQISRMSLSGAWVKRFADLCLVQWAELAEDGGRSEYAGELL